MPDPFTLPAHRHCAWGPDRALSVACLGALMWALGSSWAPAQAQVALAGTQAEQAASAPAHLGLDLPLVDHHGRPSSPRAWLGSWTWLYMGFTHCPDACPRAMDTLAGELQALKLPGSVRTAFVSLDPYRDRPEQLGTYAQTFLGPLAQAATGPRESLDALTQGLGVRYELPATAAAGLDYSVGHPNLIFLLDPQGRVALAWPIEEAAPEGALARATEAAMVAAQGGGTPISAPIVETSAAWCGPLANPKASPEAALMLRARTLGSGTAIQPANSPMRMSSLARDGWVGMGMGSGWANLASPAQGQVVPSAEAWAMAHASKAFGASLLDLRAHARLGGDSLPSAGGGHAAHGGHQAMMGELSARGTYNLSPDLAAFGYGAWGGEPAMGPGVYHHRPSAADLPSVPWGLAWLEPGHGALAVGTGGLRWQSWQLEASGHLDAQGAQPGARLTWAPGREWALATWAGRGGGLNRLGASVIHSGIWPWGQVNSTGILGYGPGTGWASLAESQVDWQSEHLALRLEAMDPGWGPPGALAFSYAHDLGPQDRMSLALGAMVGGQLANPSLPAAVEARVFLRLRPPTMP